jgi:ribonuclease HII
LRRQHRVVSKPSFAEERKLEDQGYRLIAGIDEVGRGPLAGPLVTAAVILPLKPDISWLTLVRDSKQLTPQRRESLFPLITGVATGIGIGILPSDAIDSHGMAMAVRKAMCSAVENLPCAPDFLLIDHVRLPELALHQQSITRGDNLSLSIACASIVAKVTRDRMMVALDEVYPGYGFARHKGYATREHLSQLRRLGPCPIHRRYFAPVQECMR